MLAVTAWCITVQCTNVSCGNAFSRSENLTMPESPHDGQIVQVFAVLISFTKSTSFREQMSCTQ